MGEFEVKVDGQVTDAVTLGMNCEGTGDAPGSCQTHIDISEQLKGVTSGEWGVLSVDLACFVKQEIKLGNTVIPFELTSHGALDISLTNISLVPGEANQATMSCQ